jgi:hypothetical protein
MKEVKKEEMEGKWQRKREDKLTHSKLDETNYYLAVGDLKFSLKIAWLLWASWIDPLQAKKKSRSDQTVDTS